MPNSVQMQCCEAGWQGAQALGIPDLVGDQLQGLELLQVFADAGHAPVIQVTAAGRARVTITAAQRHNTV